MGFLKEFFEKNKNKKQQFNNQSKYFSFCDDELELRWERITSRNLDNYDDCFLEMRNWSQADNIKRFITASIPLNSLFYYYLEKDAINPVGDKCNLYFCFNKEKDFVGLVYVSAPFGNRDNSSIEYLIVNPAYQNSGLGTKMVKSVVSNSDFFNNGYESGGLYASVECDNVPSYRTFLKNRFKLVSYNVSDSGKRYKVMYFSKRENIDEQYSRGMEVDGE